MRRYARPARPGPAGFTLVDILLTVAVIGILTALALPSYREAVRKVRRAEARVALLQLMQEQERYFSQAGTYIPFDIDSTNSEARKFKAYSGSSPSTSAYEISGVACAGDTARNCLVLIAAPGTKKVDSSYADPQCGSLTLNTAGQKATIPSTSSGACW